MRVARVILPDPEENKYAKIASVPGKGQGVLATRDIPAGVRIALYPGTVVHGDDWPQTPEARMYTMYQPWVTQQTNKELETYVITPGNAKGRLLKQFQHAIGPRINEPGPGESPNVVYVHNLAATPARIEVWTSAPVPAGREILACYGSSFGKRPYNVNPACNVAGRWVLFGDLTEPIWAGEGFKFTAKMRLRPLPPKQPKKKKSTPSPKRSPEQSPEPAVRVQTPPATNGRVRRQSGCSGSEAVRQRLLGAMREAERIIEENIARTGRGRPIEKDTLKAVAWVLMRKAQNPKLTQKEGVALARAAAAAAADADPDLGRELAGMTVHKLRHGHYNRLVGKGVPWSSLC